MSVAAMKWAFRQQHALTAQQGRLLLWLAWEHQDKPIAHSWRFIGHALGVNHANLRRDTKAIFEKGLVMHHAGGKGTGAFYLNLGIELDFNDDGDVVVVTVEAETTDNEGVVFTTTRDAPGVVAMTTPSERGVVNTTTATTTECSRNDYKVSSLRLQTKTNKYKKGEGCESSAQKTYLDNNVADLSQHQLMQKKETAFCRTFQTRDVDARRMADCESDGWRYDLESDKWLRVANG